MSGDNQPANERAWQALAAATGPVTVDITTTGRSTGRPRRIEIWLVSIDGRIVLGGTPGPRSWLANVRAEPNLTVHLTGNPGGVVADLAATAHEVIDVAQRRLIWEHPNTAWYRTQVTVDELVAASPTVELRPAP